MKYALVLDTTILIFKSQKLVGDLKHRNKKVFYFDFKRRHMGEEKDIASMKNKKGYWNEKYCYIGESRWNVQNLENNASHCLA